MSIITANPSKPVDNINLNSWKATNIATLVFIQQKDELLLIRKKRGLGTGKINAPGGKLDDGETIEKCAIRETQEELHVTPHNIIHCGENLFQFTDGYSIHVHNFYTNSFTGQPTETAEAIPIWYTIDNIPYEQMWEDDKLWLPMMLAGNKFKGKYLFDGDSLIDYKLEITGSHTLVTT
jgi:8-oxo-dGTP diphosphatase